MLSGVERAFAKATAPQASPRKALSGHGAGPSKVKRLFLLNFSYEHSVDGVRVSFAEFWRRGGGPAFVGVGVISILFAYGFIRARRWIRPLALIFGWGLVIWIIIGDRRLSLDVAMAFVMSGCLPTWYLYYRRSVREYFGVIGERRVA